MIKEKTENIDMVDFNKFTLLKKEVSINGKALPLKIGDKFKLAENDKMLKTIVAITVLEDGRVQYMLEWYDPDSGNFNTESVTLTELKLLHMKPIKKSKDKIGF